MEPGYFFPLTLTLSPIGGEEIKKEPWQYSLSSQRGERAGVRGGEKRNVTRLKKSCTRPAPKRIFKGLKLLGAQSAPYILLDQSAPLLDR
jgi:hypothetical protein